MQTHHSPGDQKEKQKERISLNDTKREDKDLEKHSDKDLKNLDRNLNEQMGGTDATVTSEPNQI